MNILKFLELVRDDPTIRYDGALDAEFHGFSFPGVPTASDKFFVIMDKGWPLVARKKYKQGEWTLDETIAFAQRMRVKNYILPSVLRGAEFTRGANCIYVDDVHEFIGRAGLAGRRFAAASNHPLVAITGAAGKSTLKEMIASAYQWSRPDEKVLSPGVYHNIFVRAMGELARVADYDASIFEMSGGTFDQFRRRRTAISPDVAIITNIAEAHTAQLGSAEDVAKQKSQIFNSPAPGSTAIINVDTLYADFLIQKARSEGWTLALFGESENADYRLLDYDAATQMAHVRVPQGEFSYEISAPGKHMAYNTLATLAALRGLGFDDFGPAIESFGQFNALPGRGATETIAVGNGSLELIDETYNANPASMTALIEMVSGLKLRDGQRRRVLVLGDMRELGATEEQLHRDLVPQLNSARVDRIYLFGKLMSEVQALAGRDERFVHDEVRAKLVERLASELGPGDIVAFKSSHSTGLDKVIAELRSEWKKTQ